MATLGNMGFYALLAFYAFPIAAVSVFLQLSELQRVVTYTKSSIGLQRCVFARGLCFSAVLQGAACKRPRF